MTEPNTTPTDAEKLQAILDAEADEELRAIIDAMTKELGGVGINDQQIALRLARTLHAKGVSTLTALPSRHDEGGLYQLFAGLTPAERLEAGDIIARREGHDPDSKGWPDWLHSIMGQVEHGDRIGQARTDLAASLAALAEASANVQQVCDTLREEYDVDFMEGGELTRLFTHHLAAADIAIRTAVRLNPVKED